jgi:hypothetical protein
MVKNLKITLIISCLLSLMMSCSAFKEEPNLLEQIFKAHPERFDDVINHADQFNLRIIYTKIDRDHLNNPKLKDFAYGMNNDQYFYPASTVKLPVAVMAMEKINMLNIDGLDIYTPMLTDSAYEGQTSVRVDTTAANGLPSIAHYIRKILLISDNDAFNRLYEFLGPAPINERLTEMGYPESSISHRLSLFLAPELNRYTNPLSFYKNEKLVYHQPLVCGQQTDLPGQPIKLGRGYMRAGRLMEEPMDFTNKNHLPIEDLHSMMKAIIFPRIVPRQQRFLLSSEDYAFLYKYMSMYPRESGIPGYEKYEDGYCKFFVFGGGGQQRFPGLRIFNKVGIAYGFITETAYVVDFTNHVEFMLSATMYVNKNEIFMDDEYEYDEIGFPFFRDLGLAIYAYEKSRDKECLPDLSKFMIDYK